MFSLTISTVNYEYINLCQGYSLSLNQQGYIEVISQLSLRGAHKSNLQL